MSNYRYYIQNLQVYPLNDGLLEFKFEPRDDAGFILNTVLDTPLQFNYQSGSFNFKTQREADLCDELPVKILKRCGSTWAIYWEGVFSIVECEFDDDQCICSFLPRIKEYLVNDIEINIFDDPNPVELASVQGVSSGGANTNAWYRNYKQARYFDKVILYIAQRSNANIGGIVSDFFQINPVTVSTDCLPGVTNYFKNMVFCAVSDIQEPVPTNLATREFITFRDLMNDLNVLFDVHWFIDSNYNLRIEHSTFFQGTTGIDLTTSPYAKYVKNCKKFSYELKDYPKKETWKIANHMHSGSLIYSGLANVGKSSTEKIYSTVKINTDYDSVRVYGRNSTADGIYLIATDGGAVYGYLSMLSDNVLENNNIYLQPKWLITKIHTYNRPSIYSVFEQSSKAAVDYVGGLILNSIKPTLKGKEISFPLCCGDVFDVSDTIKTPLGIGYVQEGSISQVDDRLKVVLKYKSGNCDDFDPASIPGMDLWLKYDTGITPGATGRIQQWNDQSGNGRHAVQLTTANQPFYQAGQPIRTFSVSGGNHLFLETPSFQLFPNKRGTIFCLTKEFTGSVTVGFGGHSRAVYGQGGATILSTKTGANLWDLSLAAQAGGLNAGPLPLGSRYKGFFMGGNINKFDPGIATNITELGKLYPQNQQALDPNIKGFFNDGLFVVRRANDTSMYTKQDGIYVVNNPAVIANVQVSASTLKIGGNILYSDLSGEVNVAEVIVYNRALTDREIEQVEFYFVKSGYFTITPYLI